MSTINAIAAERNVSAINLLDNAALLPGEDESKFHELLKVITATIGPKDPIEAFWVSDLAHQVWEAARYRRIAVGLLNATKQRALERVLHDLVHWDGPFDVSSLGTHFHMRSEDLAYKFILNEPAAVSEVRRILDNTGLRLDAVFGEAMALRSLEFQRIDQMIAKAESRRAATLRAIERHRTGLGAQLSQVIEEFDAHEPSQTTSANSDATKLAA